MNEPKDWPHIRCKLSCKIGRDALDGKGLDATASDQMTFSIYSLLGAGGGADELLLLQLNRNYDYDIITRGGSSKLDARTHGRTRTSAQA